MGCLFSIHVFWWKLSLVKLGRDYNRMPWMIQYKTVQVIVNICKMSFRSLVFYYVQLLVYSVNKHCIESNDFLMYSKVVSHNRLRKWLLLVIFFLFECWLCCAGGWEPKEMEREAVRMHGKWFGWCV